VGSGLVADGHAATEYAECLAKSRVLQALDRPEFDLLESLLWTPADGYWLLDRHLDRMADAADYFGFPWDRAEVAYRFDHAATWAGHL
jgi:para-aminobenzoate synthetase/4-amino-4-deoxychorismate lyase